MEDKKVTNKEGFKPNGQFAPGNQIAKGGKRHSQILASFAKEYLAQPDNKREGKQKIVVLLDTMYENGVTRPDCFNDRKTLLAYGLGAPKDFINKADASDEKQAGTNGATIINIHRVEGLSFGDKPKTEGPDGDVLDVSEHNPMG